MKIAFCDNFYILFSTQSSLTQSPYVHLIIHSNLTLWESVLIIHVNLTLRKSVHLIVHAVLHFTTRLSLQSIFKDDVITTMQ
jgi:hypothetical protein